MPKAIFRFYEELNDFLPEHRRRRDFEAEFEGRRSVKEMVEGFGVPPSEIDLILANGESVDFHHILRDGDRLSVYPVFESFNIKTITRLRKVPLRKTRFIADKNLGDIVEILQRLGFDVSCDPVLSDREIVEISNREKRILLTKRRKLLKFGEAARAILIRPGTVAGQVAKIIGQLHIGRQRRSLK